VERQRGAGWEFPAGDVLVAGLAAVVAGLVLLIVPGVPGNAGQVPAAAAAFPEREAAVPPVRVVLPGFVDAPLLPVAARLNGALDVPKPASRAGWWALGAAPGSAAGTVLLAGHVDSSGEGLGAFAALREVPLGTRVTVTGGDGSRHTYRLTARRIYRQDALPRDLFHGALAPRLALVTCVGSFDPSTRRYSDNLVLYGVPVGGR
jgi:hypothetical protein